MPIEAQITEKGPIRVLSISSIETPDVVLINVEFRDRNASVIAANIEDTTLTLDVMNVDCPSQGLTVIEVALPEGDWREFSSTDEWTSFRITLNRADLSTLRVTHYSAV